MTEGEMPAADMPAPDPGPAHPLTIEQLAQQSGLSVRNIRSHQARGLLPPPEVRRRVGYYGDEHLERLRVIGELQAQGLHLKAVKQLLDDTQGTVERLLTLRRSIAEPVALEPSEVLTDAELDEQLKAAGPELAKLLHKLRELGFVVPIGAGHNEVASPSLLGALSEALTRGISGQHVIELLESLHSHTEAVARRLVKNFVDDIWKPYLAADAPEQLWPEIAESLSRLRGLGSQAVTAVFSHAISQRIDSTLGDATKRLSERKR
ncbi:MAG: MerR family transcriptional regulator [Solirubrobacteraceae bacterium]